jgi:hypothetical protein
MHNYSISQILKIKNFQAGRLDTHSFGADYAPGQIRDRSLITGGGAGGNEKLDAKILLPPPWG